MSKKRQAELQERVKELEAYLGIEAVPFEEWMVDAPQLWRDKFAATIYFQSLGCVGAALKRLGIKYTVPTMREIADKVFQTPGCQEIINRNLSDATECKPAIVERLTHTALHGPEENASHATSLLARMCGWIKEPTLNIDNRRVNLYQLGAQAPQQLPAGSATVERPPLEGILDHEPGEAVRVSSDDRIDSLLEQTG